MTLVVLYLFSYLLGSVPFGYLVGRARGVDITKVGSGNIGATNTYRALGWKAGLTVFVLDVGKGAVPPLLARALVKDLPADVVTLHCVFMGVAAVLGHSF